ncbi:unnamed protein product [Mytilus edulis]|uniref:Mitochondria-eating protein C-terminal domain-containing protein n=1 Tax=Mytilus edulis TaxID=6550 RepID=A0A8S3RMB6_MYTED|nr:unnamed protein product [Mytilus edulis]
MTKTKKSAKKRPKNDNNKHGKKEQPDKEEANQNEKPMTKEDTTILYRGFSHIKGLVAYLCWTLPLMIFKSPYTIIICIWTSFCAFCGRLTKIFSFRRKKDVEKTETPEENADVKTSSESPKTSRKKKKQGQDNRLLPKSDSNGKLNLMEKEKETPSKRITEREEELKTMESQRNIALNRVKEIEAQLNTTDKEKKSALKRVTDFEQKLKAAESAKGDAMKKIKELETNLKSTEKENFSYQRVKDVEQKFKATESEKEDALKKGKDFEQKLKAFDSDKENALKRVKDVEQKLKATDSDKENSLKGMYDNNFHLFINRVKDFEHRLKSTELDKEDALKRLKQYMDANAYLQREHTNALERITEAEQSVRVLSQEKSDALTRLSDIMGTKLRDNNPAITDLNDPNRPMKLGDQFSELYENEWTDAFSDIMDCTNLKLSEIETIDVLLNILKEIYNICLEDIEEQLSGHKKLVHGFSDDEIEPFLKTAKESVKTNAANYIPLLCRKIISSTSACKLVAQYKDFSLQYIENCVKICYFAAVQNPPMVIDFEPGQIFDKQSYREYTRSGTVVEYLVWPVLYLHKGGPILSKGVVQPKEENNSNK